MRPLIVTVRLAAGETVGSDMPRYAQLVMGPAGSGKVRTWREKEGQISIDGKPGGSGTCVYCGP